MYCSWCHSKIFENDRTCPQCGGPTFQAIDEKFKEQRKYSNFPVIRSLDEITMFAGDDFNLVFDIYNDEGNRNPVSGNMIWKISPYGQPSNTIFSKINPIKKGKVIVDLTRSDTRDLSGKFAYQCIVNYDNAVYNCAAGTINIIPAFE